MEVLARRVETLAAQIAYLQGDRDRWKERCELLTLVERHEEQTGEVKQ